MLLRRWTPELLAFSTPFVEKRYAWVLKAIDGRLCQDTGRTCEPQGRFGSIAALLLFGLASEFTVNVNVVVQSPRIFGFRASAFETSPGS